MACNEKAFLDEFTTKPTLQQWVAQHSICGIEQIKAAMNKTEHTPTILLDQAIASGDLKSAAFAMRKLRNVMDYDAIPRLSKKMVNAAISAEKTILKMPFNFGIRFSGVAFGKQLKCISEKTDADRMSCR